MGKVTRRAFLASGSAGAVAIAGVASGGFGAMGLMAAEDGELTPEEHCATSLAFSSYVFFFQMCTPKTIQRTQLDPRSRIRSRRRSW